MSNIENDPKEKIKEVVKLLIPGSEEGSAKIGPYDIIHAKGLEPKVSIKAESENKNVIRLMIEIGDCEKTYKLGLTDERKFGEILVKLKDTRSFHSRNRERCDEIVEKKAYVLNTCYDDKKGESLKNALDSIKELLKNEYGGEELFRKFLYLLMVAYACPDICEAEYYDYEKYEWFISLVRAVAKSKRGASAYLPLCPSLGDAVAVLYYYLFVFSVTANKCREKTKYYYEGARYYREGNLASCINDALKKEVEIRKNDVKSIVDALISS